MIKVETLGMYDVAKVNPILVSDKEVANHSFITVDDVLYLVDNTIVGDDAYKEGIVFPAGEKLNGYDVKAWEGQKLVVDNKHITYASTGVTEYSKIVEGTTLLKAKSDGTLEVATSAPSTGIYFKVTDKCTLTENAVKVKVIIA